MHISSTLNAHEDLDSFGEASTETGDEADSRRRRWEYIGQPTMSETNHTTSHTLDSPPRDLNEPSAA